ncbi:hypothetical protein [Nostoc sp.]
MSPSLEKILSEIEQLTPEEQLTVMGHLVKRVKSTSFKRNQNASGAT